MSLPTAHSYILKEWKENLEAIDADFLKPNLLIKHISKAEDALSRDSQTLRGREFSNNMSEIERSNIIELVKQMKSLEKSANEKLGWANEFAKFLQTYPVTK